MLVLIAISGCGGGGTESDVITQVFANTTNRQIVRSAERVQTCRLKPIDVSNQTASSLGVYEEGPFVQVTAERADRFRAVLENPRSYYFNVAKSCLPVYGVRVRFESKGETIDVDLCFECNLLSVNRDVAPVGGGNFDPARPELVAICKELFADDPEIQKLNPGRP